MIKTKYQIQRGDFSLDVDLSFPAHGVTALFGASGCGKTTLLRAIAGLDKHPGGYLQVGDVLWQSATTFIPTHKRSLAYVFQEPGLFTHLDVKRNLEYGVKRLPESERKVSLQQAIELLDIAPLLSRKPNTLSGGERQRVAIARALAVSPRLLLMDEPLAALDLERKKEILPYIESLHRSLDIPIIYVSHAHDEVARLADHMVILDSGCVKAAGDVHTIFSRLELPLAHGNDAGAIIEARVTGHDETFNLTHLDFEGGKIILSQKTMKIDDQARIRLAARDISLTLEHQTDTSILNILPVTVDQLSEESSAQVTVRLLAGNTPILSRITRKSASDLALKPGKKVYAQIKSVALL